MKYMSSINWLVRTFVYPQGILGHEGANGQVNENKSAQKVVQVRLLRNQNGYIHFLHHFNHIHGCGPMIGGNQAQYGSSGCWNILRPGHIVLDGSAVDKLIVFREFVDIQKFSFHISGGRILPLVVGQACAEWK